MDAPTRRKREVVDPRAERAHSLPAAAHPIKHKKDEFKKTGVDLRFDR